MSKAPEPTAMGDSLDQESTDAVGLYAAVHANQYFVLQTKHWTVSPEQLMHLLWSGLLRRDGIELHLSVSPLAWLSFRLFPDGDMCMSYTDVTASL